MFIAREYFETLLNPAEILSRAFWTSLGFHHQLSNAMLGLLLTRSNFSSRSDSGRLETVLHQYHGLFDRSIRLVALHHAMAMSFSFLSASRIFFWIFTWTGESSGA